jgi:hypothetical protein
VGHGVTTTVIAPRVVVALGVVAGRVPVLLGVAEAVARVPVTVRVDVGGMPGVPVRVAVAVRVAVKVGRGVCVAEGVAVAGATISQRSSARAFPVR